MKKRIALILNCWALPPSCVAGSDVGNILLHVIIDLVAVVIVQTGGGHICPPNVLPLYKPTKLSVSSYVRFGTNVQQLLPTYLCFVRLLMCFSVRIYYYYFDHLRPHFFCVSIMESEPVEPGSSSSASEIYKNSKKIF